jgi:hypothetical protein
VQAPLDEPPAGTLVVHPPEPSQVLHVAQTVLVPALA